MGTLNKTIRGLNKGTATLTASDGTHTASVQIECKAIIDIDDLLHDITMGNYVQYDYTFTNADGTPGAQEPTITSADTDIATVSDKTYNATTGRGSFRVNAIKHTDEAATTITISGYSGGEAFTKSIGVNAKKPTAAFDQDVWNFNSSTVGCAVRGTYTGSPNDMELYNIIIDDGAGGQPHVTNELKFINSDGTFSMSFDTPSGSGTDRIYVTYNLLGTVSTVATATISWGDAPQFEEGTTPADNGDDVVGGGA